jgi:hypothetical protein
MKVSVEKPAAMLYIDDRAYQFNGTFPSVDYVRDFLPWYKRPKVEETEEPDGVQALLDEYSERLQESAEAKAKPPAERLRAILERITPA